MSTRGCRLFHTAAATAILLALRGAPGWAAARDIEIVELERTPEHSVHRVRVWTQEIPHYHARHDSKVVIERGGGILYLNGIAHPLVVGDTIEIPRRVPHYFVHRSSEPFTQARVTFTPPYDGKDRIPIPSADAHGSDRRPYPSH